MVDGWIGALRSTIRRDDVIIVDRAIKSKAYFYYRAVAAAATGRLSLTFLQQSLYRRQHISNYHFTIYFLSLFILSCKQANTRTYENTHAKARTALTAAAVWA